MRRPRWSPPARRRRGGLLLALALALGAALAVACSVDVPLGVDPRSDAAADAGVRG